MVSVVEAPADKLIGRVAEMLKAQGIVKPPEWARFVKTGAHAERAPQDAEGFWYARCASMLRRLYVEGNVGVGRLRTWYGGRRNPGTRPEHHADAGGKIIREAFRQLEAAGFVKKEKAGRSLTAKGRSLLDKTCMEFYGGERRGRRVGGVEATEAGRPAARPKRKTGKARTRKTAGTAEKEVAGQAPGAPDQAEAGEPAAGEPAAGGQG